MNCQLCGKRLKFRRYDYFNLIKTVHIHCIEQLEKEADTIQRQTNIQRVKQNQELRVYQIKRLLDNEISRKNEIERNIQKVLIDCVV